MTPQEYFKEYTVSLVFSDRVISNSFRKSKKISKNSEKKRKKNAAKRKRKKLDSRNSKLKDKRN